MMGAWFGSEPGAWARNVAAFLFALLFWAVWTFWLFAGGFPQLTWPIFGVGAAVLLLATWRGVWRKRAARRVVAVLWMGTALFFTRPFGVDILDASLHKNAFLCEQIALNHRLKPGASHETVLNFLADRGFRTYDGRSLRALRAGEDDTFFQVPQAGADICGPYDLCVNIAWENKRLGQILLFQRDRTCNCINGVQGCRKWRVLDYPF